MKKIFYILVLSIVSSLAISSCTEQEVKPSIGASGANSSDPKG
ncbi:hypothetical protein BH10BAC4_BH10BAC4_08790 [soil metagenome]